MRHHNQTPIHRRNYDRQLQEQHKSARQKKIQLGLVDPEDEDIQLNFAKTQREEEREKKRQKLKEMQDKTRANRREKEGRNVDEDTLIGNSISLKEMMKEKMKKGFKKKWELIIDKETGKIAFYNSLTGEKKKEQPDDIKLDAEDQKILDRSKDNVSISTYND